jgi:hypothetical protein
LYIEREILDYMAVHYLTVEQTTDGKFLLTDVKTGEKILMARNPYDWNNSILRNVVIRSFLGQNPTTGETVDWTERVTLYREQAKKDYIATLPKIMRAPRECLCGSGQSFAEIPQVMRYPIGRIKTDGKSDNYLRLECLPIHISNNVEAQFDYFELVPKFVYDNQEIPEE